MMKVKVQFGSDIRRWHYPETKRYQNLLAFVKQTFNFLDERQFYVQFEDDEGDHLTLTSETDFEDAFSCAEQEGRKSLKIFIMKGLIEDSHNNNMNNINSSSLSFSSAASVTSHMQPLSDEKEQHEQPKSKVEHEEKKEVGNDKKGDEKFQESCQGSNNCYQWRQLALDFLQNKEIQSLLPQLARRVIASLRKEQQQTSDKKNLLQIVQAILGEEEFKPIVKHELYAQKLVFVLPCVIGKIENYQHALLAFNEDAIESWVPHLINILTSSLSRFENIDVEIDVDPMVRQFCPLFSFINDDCSQNCSNDNKSTQQIHSNVTCDNCERFPITGIRYKCGVCNDYDLCAACEALGKHDAAHPMLKINCPAACANRHYDGLHEFLKSSFRHGHGRFHHRFHPRPHHFWPQHCRRFSERFDNNMHRNATSNCCSRSNYNEEKNRFDCQFVSDVTIPDKSYCPVDTVMTKIWRVRNNGDVEWGNDVELVFFKGDECLALEKRYPVSNVKPGQEVDVSAVIKTPLKSGLYSAFFRLKKNDSFFGSQMWVELFAVEESDELPQAEKHAICICGETLVGVPANQAYNGGNVYCNVCRKKCPSHTIIYHCPQKQNVNHSRGYDMCSSCVDVQIASFISSNSNKKPENDNDNENKIDDFVPIIPSISSAIVNENVNNDQSNASPKNSEPEVIEMELLSDDENEKDKQNEEKFEFKEQLNSLKEMGFVDIEALKVLLIKHKGDVQRVVQELIQA